MRKPQYLVVSLNKPVSCKPDSAKTSISRGSKSGLSSIILCFASPSSMKVELAMKASWKGDIILIMDLSVVFPAKLDFSYDQAAIIQLDSKAWVPSQFNVKCPCFGN